MIQKKFDESIIPEDTLKILMDLYRNGKSKETETLAKSLIKKFPKNIICYQVLGSTYKKTKRFHEALETNRKAISLFPRSAELHNNLGNTLSALNKIEDAETSYRKAIELKPSFADAQYSLGLNLMKMKKISEAEICFTKAISLKFSFAPAHYHLGNIFKNRKEIFKAEVSFKKAIALKPEFAEAHNNLGVTYVGLGKKPEAEECFKRAIELQPEYAEAYNNLGNLLREMRRYYEAQKVLKKAIELDPDFAEARINLNAVCNFSIPSWHIPMINDAARNDAYFAAIKRAVDNDTLVLEIGTGSGLLSMMAAESGAGKVITCETVETIAKTARKIIDDNGYGKKITVLNKKSTELIVGEDMPRKADLMISEILSAEFVGEGVRTTLSDANKRLVKRSGKVIPETGTIKVALIGESPEILSIANAMNVYGYDLSTFNSITKSKIDLKLEKEAPFLSRPKDAFDLCLSDSNNISKQKKNLELKCNKEGNCIGLIQWISINLYEDIKYENVPGKGCSHWPTPIYLFDEPMKLKIGDRVTIKGFLGEDSVWFYKPVSKKDNNTQIKYDQTENDVPHT